MTTYTLGMLSGTSIDAIDVALVAHQDSHQPPRCVDTHSHAIPNELQQRLRALCQPGQNEIERWAECDTQLGMLFAEAASTLLDRHPNKRPHVIGFHGQTIRHLPNSPHHFTLQIGNPHIIAQHTGIDVICDFRRGDIARGGQGAPLAPLVHSELFWQPNQPCAVVNIGGMSNISWFDGIDRSKTIGFDTGPGNALMDAWIRHHHHRPYDNAGTWAMSGQINEELLASCLAHPFFGQKHPKSTGHEDFNLTWLRNLLPTTTDPADVQRTLLEVTARSISDAVMNMPQHTTQLWVAGGGALNTALLQRLQQLLANTTVTSSDEHGFAAEWLEAILFAWLAQQCLQRKPMHTASITGANRPGILGVLVPAQ